MKEPYVKGAAIRTAPSFARVLSRGRPRSVNRGIGGLGIELRKLPIGAPTTYSCRKATCTGTLTRVTVQPCVVGDPSARLETSYTRTGRPRRHLSARHYGEIHEEYLLDLSHRLRRDDRTAGEGYATSPGGKTSR